jgi:hypothetical protein
MWFEGIIYIQIEKSRGDDRTLGLGQKDSRNDCIIRYDLSMCYSVTITDIR